MSGQRRFKRSLSIRTSRLPSEVIYDRQLESIYDPKKGYTHRVVHSRLSPTSIDSRSPRPFLLQSITGDSRTKGKYKKLNQSKLSQVELGSLNAENNLDKKDSEEDDEEDDEILRSLRGTERALTYYEQIVESFIRFCEGQRSWIFLMFLGVITSLLAYLLDEVSDLLLQARFQLATIISQTNGWWMSYFFYSGWAFAMAPMACILTLLLHDQASGSGIPQLKSLMAGYNMKSFLGIRMLLAKITGSLLALGSGLLVGKEGPFVCIAASIAILLMRYINLFKHMETNVSLQRDALSAACACGVAATFGAPIGGVLFAIEVTSSLFHVSSYWKGFFAAVCGAVVFKELQVMNIGRGRLNNVVSLFSTQFQPLPYSTVELIPFICIGIFSGYLSSFYLYLQERLNYLLKKKIFFDNELFSLRGNVMLVASIAGLHAIFTYPFGEYMINGLRRSIDDLFHEGKLNDYTKLYANNWVVDNSLGSSASSSSAIINGVVTNDEDNNINGLFIHLTLFILIKFIFSAASLTLPVPFGVIIPVFSIGAALGRLIGELLQLAGYTAVTPGGYAVVGAAAFTAGVTHTVSIALIVFELTSQLSYMLPVLLAVLVSRMVSSRSSLHPGGIFFSIGRQLNLYIDPVLGNDSSYVLRVEDLDLLIHRNNRRGSSSNSSSSIIKIDNSNSQDIPLVERSITQRKLKYILNRHSTYSEFAVVESDDSMIFLGTVSRRELEEISESDILFTDNVSEDKNIEMINLASKIQKWEKQNIDQVKLQEEQEEDVDQHQKEHDERKQSSSSVHAETKEHSPPPPSSPSPEFKLDLVGAELLDLDFSTCIKVTVPLSELVLKFASCHAQSLFLLRRGRVVGILHVSDLTDIGL